jgi:uncharacterized protein
MTAAPSSPGHPCLDAARGEWRDGNTRYLLIRDDSLMGMFRRLPPPARGQALVAMAAAVAEAGGRSAARYREADPSGAEALLRQVGEVAARLGWGVWRFERGAAGELSLEVANSPFAAGFGDSAEPVCAPIAGMLEAVATMVMGRPAVAEEISCGAAGGGSCRFAARVQAD